MTQSYKRLGRQCPGITLVEVAKACVPQVRPSTPPPERLIPGNQCMRGRRFLNRNSRSTSALIVPSAINGHDYAGIDLERVWETAQRDIPG